MTADGSAEDTQSFFHITVLNLGDQTSPSDFCTWSLPLQKTECKRPRTNVTFYLGWMGGDIFGSIKVFFYNFFMSQIPQYLFYSSVSMSSGSLSLRTFCRGFGRYLNEHSAPFLCHSVTFSPSQD